MRLSPGSRAMPAVLFAVLLAAATPLAGQESDERLLTEAERSEFRATTPYNDVVRLCERLAETSPRVHLTELGRTVEDRSIPLLVLADPPVTSAEEALRGDRLVALALGNIHAGEVCGKEALLMLAREVALAESHPLLEKLVIAIVPIYNADGNERIDVQNRPGQVGPEEGVGTRENAQGLDLNRDWIKLEAPETRAMIRFLNRWDPALIIDTHTTNGSYHRYRLTYAGPKNPAGDEAIIEYTRDRFLPEVSRRLLESKGIDTWFYGNFEAGHTVWSTYPDLPRYGTPYRGLRGRVAILSEAYAYDTFEGRVRSTLAFTRECLRMASDQAATLRELVESTDRRARESGAATDFRPLVPIRSEALPFEEKAIVKGYLERLRDGEMRRTDQERDYEVDFVNRFVPTASVTKPFAYLIPSGSTAVIDNLRQHGIRLEKLREDVDLQTQAYRVDWIERDDDLFQGHRLTRVRATPQSGLRRVPAGTVIAWTDQRLSQLLVYLLEPESADGLATWNFFDKRLAVGKPFPVLRLIEDVDLLTAPLGERQASEEEPRPLTYETVYDSSDRPDLNGNPARVLRWLPDGEHYLQRRGGDLRRVHAETGRVEPYAPIEAVRAALSGLPALDEETAQRLSRRLHLNLDDDETSSLFEHGDDLYLCELDGSSARRLTSDPQEEELASLSPDGEFVAFVKDNDLWVVDAATATPRQLTSGGRDKLRRGKNDWVYYEEVFRRDWRAYWWSPGSRHLAFLEIDSRPVKDFVLVNDLVHRQEIERTPYPKPGEPNPRARVGIVSVAGGEVDWIDLPQYDEGDHLITGVGWTPGAEKVYFYVQDRIQTWLDFHLVRRGETKSERLFRETTGAWVDPPSPPHFLEDGSMVLTSESSGWKHLYRVGAHAGKRLAITEGEWEVGRLLSVDEEAGWAYFTGSRDSFIASNLYRASLAGKKVERLTSEPGHHSVQLDPTNRYFVDSWSTTDQPTRVVLRRSDGSRLRTIDTNPVPDLDRVALSPIEHHQIPARDGFLLEAQLTKPLHMAPGRKYPVWFMTYGGPHAPTVWNSWHGGRAWEQVLAERGFVVFRCDPRSASGKGARSAWTAYLKLGVQELADIKDAIRWLREQPFVDGDRIGMSGHSYGGFLTAYAMTHSKLFAAGIAGAPVTDWRDYDTIYTERYMSTPQLNPEGYSRTSVREAAADLHGRLLLVHGARDDNVHLQNTLRLVDALQRAEKQFELMLYPANRHGIWGRHYRKLRYDFIVETLGDPQPAP